MSLQSKLANNSRRMAKIGAPTRVQGSKIPQTLAPTSPHRVKVEWAQKNDEDRAFAADVLGEDRANEFEATLARYAALGDKIKALEAKRDEIKGRITAAVEGSGYKTLAAGGFQATYVAGATRTKLEPKLLLQAGVTVEQIAKATIKTVGNPYVVVTKAQEGAE